MSLSRSAARIRDQLCGRESTSLTRSCLPNEPTCPACSADQPIVSTRRHAEKPLPILRFQLGISQDGIAVCWGHSDPALSLLDNTASHEIVRLLVHLRASSPSKIEKLQPHSRMHMGGARLWALAGYPQHICAQRQVRLHQSMYLYMHKRRGSH